jgi:hypothetical protein
MNKTFIFNLFINRNIKRVSINSGIYTSTSLKMGHRGRDLDLVLRDRIAVHL